MLSNTTLLYSTLKIPKWYSWKMSDKKTLNTSPITIESEDIVSTEINPTSDVQDLISNSTTCKLGTFFPNSIDRNQIYYYTNSYMLYLVHDIQILLKPSILEGTGSSINSSPLDHQQNLDVLRFAYSNHSTIQIEMEFYKTLFSMKYYLGISPPNFP